MKNLSQLLKVITLMNKLLNQNTINLSVLISIFFTLILSLIAGFRPLEYFRDTNVYLEMIATYDNIWQSEPTFWIINQFNQLLLGGNDQIFFLIYAILGVTIKIIAINRLSSLPLLSVYLYICLYFVLHEMTQIRVGVATAIFLLAIPNLINKDFKIYVLKMVLAISFHYSAILMLPLYFISSKKINKIFYFFLPIIGLILGLIPQFMLSIFNFFEFIFPSPIAEKVTQYLLVKEQELSEELSFLSFSILNLILFYYFALLNINKIKTELNILLIKILGLQIFAYYTFIIIPTFATRISEFYGICLLILIPNLCFLFIEKKLSILFILIWGAVYFFFKSIKLILI